VPGKNTNPAPVFSRRAIRRLDALALRRYAIPGLLLMETAGRAVADAARARLGPTGRVLILAGPGNNGGDGLVAARHLLALGVPVRVLLTAPPSPRSDAGVNLRILRRAKVAIDRLDRPKAFAAAQRQLSRLTTGDVLIDALLGTGLSRPVDPDSPVGQLILRANARRAKPARPFALAVDIPSALDADTGQPLLAAKSGAPSAAPAAFIADQTVTFVGLKRGLLAPAARRWVGRVCVAPLGVPGELVRLLADRPSPPGRSGYAHTGQPRA
jgi:hydroxyethylthiazole kinase-like uncharacterized protein yjeF